MYYGQPLQLSKRGLFHLPSFLNVLIFYFNGILYTLTDVLFPSPLTTSSHPRPPCPGHHHTVSVGYARMFFD